MRWSTVLTDATGTIDAIIWDKACFELFEISAGRLREMWEQGVDDPNQQDSILDVLNKNLEKEVTCMCSTVVRKYGYKTVKTEIQLHVNALEMIDVPV